MKSMRKKLISLSSLVAVATLSLGFAVVSGDADESDVLEGFAVTATSIRTVDPSGLRFRIELPESVGMNDVTNAYTVITLTPAAGEEKDQTISSVVPATVWRPSTDGNGWNTVLLGIPETDYTTVITAQAFVTLNEKEYQTEMVSSSIAKTASLVMNKNNTIDSTLNSYITDVENITLDNSNVEVVNNSSLTLTATLTSKSSTEYGVVWQSSNEDVAIVDNNGVVTTVGEGTAEITATIGGVTSEPCLVTAKYVFDSTFESWNTETLKNAVNVAYQHQNKYAMSIAEDPVGENGKVIKFERKLGHGSATKLNLKLTADVINDVQAGSVLAMQVYGERPQGSDTIKLVVNAVETATGTQGVKIGEQILVTGSATASDSWTTVEFALTETQVNAIKASGVLQFELSGNSTSESVYYIDDLTFKSKSFDGTFESWNTETLKESVYVAYQHQNKYAMSIAEDPVGENGKVIKFERKLGHSSATMLNLKLTADFVNKVKVGSTLAMQVYGERPQGSDTIKLVVNAVETATSRQGGLKIGEQVLVTGSATASASWTNVEFALTEAQVEYIKASGVLQFELNGNSTSESVYYIDDLMVKVFDGTFESWNTETLKESVYVAYQYQEKYSMSIAEDPVGENGKVIKFERKLGHSSATKLNLKLTAGFINQLTAGTTLTMQVYGERPQGSDTIKLIVNAVETATSKQGGLKIGEQVLVTGSATASASWTTVEFTLTEAQVEYIKASGVLQFELNGNSTSESVYYIDDLMVKSAA